MDAKADLLEKLYLRAMTDYLLQQCQLNSISSRGEEAPDALVLDCRWIAGNAARTEE
jgi:hypothetical protein